MSRHSFLPDRLSTRGRVALAAAAALGLVVTAAVLIPRDDADPDGSLAPTTGEQYVARDSAPGPGAVTDAASAEIDRVLAESPARISARLAPGQLADRLSRCAEFEGQRYCLGRGWTDTDPTGALRTEAAGRSLVRETTGDLATHDLLARRAALSPAERLAEERAELLAAARSVAKVVLLRHHLLGEPLPEGFLERHPEARATTTQPVTARSRTKTLKDYPRSSKVLKPRQVRAQRTTYWCGPASMQMIAWGWHDKRRVQKHWARKLGTTTSGTAITDMVRVVNNSTGWNREAYAGDYIVLDISDWSFRKWLLLQMRHVHDYRAPVVLHPILLKRYFPYLDDDASGHFQVGRGYDKRGKKPAHLGFFEPWNQQRFDPSEPYIKRVQWRNAYQSYRANQAHPHQNIGV